VISIGDVDGVPAYPAALQMNFPAKQSIPVLASLNWLTIEEDYAPGLSNPSCWLLQLILSSSARSH
jgi:hypothetical protein